MAGHVQADVSTAACRRLYAGRLSVASVDSLQSRCATAPRTAARTRRATTMSHSKVPLWWSGSQPVRASIQSCQNMVRIPRAAAHKAIAASAPARAFEGFTSGSGPSLNDSLDGNSMRLAPGAVHRRARPIRAILVPATTCTNKPGSQKGANRAHARLGAPANAPTPTSSSSGASLVSFAAAGGASRRCAPPPHRISQQAAVCQHAVTAAFLLLAGSCTVSSQ